VHCALCFRLIGSGSRTAEDTTRLGSAWTTLHLAYEREIAELLGIPPTVRQGVLLPAADTVGTDFRPAHRAPLDDVLHIDGW
jgi:hypothetical protein